MTFYEIHRQETQCFGGDFEISARGKRCFRARSFGKGVRRAPSRRNQACQTDVPEWKGSWLRLGQTLLNDNVIRYFETPDHIVNPVPFENPTQTARKRSRRVPFRDRRPSPTKACIWEVPAITDNGSGEKLQNSLTGNRLSICGDETFRKMVTIFIEKVELIASDG